MSKKSVRRGSSAGLSNLSLVIYPSHALVSGEYAVGLGSGKNNFQVQGLPTQYDPSSLFFDTFRGPGEVTLGPTSYRAANLTPGALLQASINKTVTVRYGGALESEQYSVTGKLVAVQGNSVVLRVPGQGVRVINNVVGYQYSSVPSSLSNTPWLAVEVEASEAGDYVAKLLYKALGFSWSADYKWIYDEARGVVTWDGSVFVTNNSGATFENAQLKVVAGDAGEEAEGFAADAMPMAAMASLESTGGARSSRSVRQATNESLGQVKVFTIPVRGTIGEGESQKIPFFNAVDVPVRTEHRVGAQHNWHYHRAARVDCPVQTILIFQNDKENKLGQPLPGGSVSVMQRGTDGCLLKSGGGRLNDVAVGEECKLGTGTDFDLKATRVVLDLKQQETIEEMPAEHAGTDASGKAVKKNWKKIVVTKQCAIELFNGKGRDVEFVIEETASGNELRFSGEHGFTQTVAGQYEQKVAVAAGQKATVNYTLVQTTFQSIR